MDALIGIADSETPLAVRALPEKVKKLIASLTLLIGVLSFVAVYATAALICNPTPEDDGSGCVETYNLPTLHDQQFSVQNNVAQVLHMNSSGVAIGIAIGVRQQIDMVELNLRETMYFSTQDKFGYFKNQDFGGGLTTLTCDWKGIVFDQDVAYFGSTMHNYKLMDQQSASCVEKHYDDNQKISHGFKYDISGPKVAKQVRPAEFMKYKIIVDNAFFKESGLNAIASTDGMGPNGIGGLIKVIGGSSDDYDSPMTDNMMKISSELQRLDWSFYAADFSDLVTSGQGMVVDKWERTSDSQQVGFLCCSWESPVALGSRWYASFSLVMTVLGVALTMLLPRFYSAHTDTELEIADALKSHAIKSDQNI